MIHTIEHDIESVKSLNPGEDCVIFWSEEQGGTVYFDGKIYILCEVTGYGSYESKYGEFTKDQIEELVTIAHTWT